MAVQIHYMKQHDLLPQLQAGLLNGVVAVNLSTATSVKFLMSNAIVGTVASAAATITDAVNGGVAYTWSPGDTDVAGTYKAEFEVTWSSGKKQTFPNDSYLQVKILADLG